MVTARRRSLFLLVLANRGLWDDQLWPEGFSLLSTAFVVCDFIYSQVFISIARTRGDLRIWLTFFCQRVEAVNIVWDGFDNTINFAYNGFGLCLCNNGVPLYRRLPGRIFYVIDFDSGNKVFISLLGWRGNAIFWLEPFIDHQMFVILLVARIVR